MIRSSLLTLLFLSVFGSSFAQNPGCDGDRFRNHVFADADSTVDIFYGTNESYSGFPIDLYMDIYEPAGDTMTNRPLIVLAHGGSYVFGDRKQLRLLCIDLAKRGYVAATMNYRLYYALGTPLDTLKLFDVVMKSVGDMRAAIRFMRQSVDSGNVYGINPDWVMAGGVSSGGITAMLATYMRDTNLMPQYARAILDSNGGMEGNTLDNYQYSSDVKAVLGFSAAVRDTSWIPSTSTQPAFCVHEDNDMIVPYGTATITTAGLAVELAGSKSITEKLTASDVYNELITFENNAGHVSYFLDTTGVNYKLVIDGMASFLETVYCPDFSDTIFMEPDGISESASGFDLNIFPNPGQEIVMIDAGDHNILSVQVTNLNGQVVHTENSASQSGSTFPLHIASLENGIYFVTTKTRSGKSAIGKLVIQQ